MDDYSHKSQNVKHGGADGAKKGLDREAKGNGEEKERKKTNKAAKANLHEGKTITEHVGLRITESD